jgi:two-component system response regulator YesN
MTSDQRSRMLWVGGSGGERAAVEATVSSCCVVSAANYREAQKMLRDDHYDLLLLDLSGAHEIGLRNLRRLKDLGYSLDVIAVNGEACIEKAVQTIKAGAWDYLPHPLCLEKLADRLANRRQTGPSAAQSDPVVGYICEHATAISTRAEVAQRFGLSPDTVSCRVRSVTGRTFTEFLHACRLEQARHLLESTALNVSQVAARVGFSTSQHFARVFRRYSGLSPARYRLQKRARKNSAA